MSRGAAGICSTRKEAVDASVTKSAHTAAMYSCTLATHNMRTCLHVCPHARATSLLGYPRGGVRLRTNEPKQPKQGVTMGRHRAMCTRSCISLLRVWHAGTGAPWAHARAPDLTLDMVLDHFI